MKCIDKLLKATKNTRIGNHKVELTGSCERYIYHNTCICEVNHISHTITYSNGGYNTPSTTRAINSYKRSSYINNLTWRGYITKEV